MISGLNPASISIFLHKIDTLRWTPHLDECLQVLSQEKECPGDELLVQQVRMQRIAERAYEETADGREVTVDYINELDNMRDTLPAPSHHGTRPTSPQ